MEKLISKKLTELYLDYNSTAPLSDEHLLELSKGGGFRYNPSSTHFLGKEAKKHLKKCEDFLFSFFKLNSHDWRLIFHSGATEGIATFFKSADLSFQKACFATDHSAVLNCMDKDSLVLPVDRNGDALLNEAFNKKLWLNWTVANNETGVIWPVDLTKDLESSIIHLDLTQVPGKLEFDGSALSDHIKMISFSGHKFGALKGVGASFIRRDFKLKPLVAGGGQQGGQRGGTLNVLGAQSMVLALKHIPKKAELKKIAKLRDEIEEIFNQHNIEVAGAHAKYGRLPNTTYLIFKDTPSDQMLIQFDLRKIAVSAGSACQAGTHRPSHVLLAMGYGELSKHGIRLSLGKASLDLSQELIKKLSRIH